MVGIMVVHHGTYGDFNGVVVSGLILVMLVIT